MKIEETRKKWNLRNQRTNLKEIRKRKIRKLRKSEESEDEGCFCSASAFHAQLRTHSKVNLM